MDPFTPCTYEASRQRHINLFSNIVPPINAEHICHLWRGEGVRQAADRGVSHDQLAKGGRWKADGALDRAYLDTLIPMEFVRTQAGFPSQRGFYSLQRNRIMPTQVTPYLTNTYSNRTKLMLNFDRLKLMRHGRGLKNFVNLLIPHHFRPRT